MLREPDGFVAKPLRLQRDVEEEVGIQRTEGDAELHNVLLPIGCGARAVRSAGARVGSSAFSLAGG